MVLVCGRQEPPSHLPPPSNEHFGGGEQRMGSRPVLKFDRRLRECIHPIHWISPCIPRSPNVARGGGGLTCPPVRKLVPHKSALALPGGLGWSLGLLDPRLRTSLSSLAQSLRFKSARRECHCITGRRVQCRSLGRVRCPCHPVRRWRVENELSSDPKRRKKPKS